MEFTKIENENPIVVPPVEEKVFDKQWLSHIRINSSPIKAQVIAYLVPYNGSEVLSEPIESLVIDNLFEAMKDTNRPAELRTKYAQLMELLLQTVQAEKVYLKAVQVEKDRLEALQKEEVITEEDTTPEEPTPEL